MRPSLTRERLKPLQSLGWLLTGMILSVPRFGLPCSSCPRSPSTCLASDGWVKASFGSPSLRFCSSSCYSSLHVSISHFPHPRGIQSGFTSIYICFPCIVRSVLTGTVIVMLGANPQSDRFGFRNWKEGAFAEHISTGSLGRFLGFWSVFIQASFAYGVPDYPCMCAGEAMYPRRVLPAVFGRIVYRLMFFYVGGVLCVGILVPHTDALLGTAQKGAGASPFVLAAVRLGIPVFPSVINAFILTSAWSCGTALSFTASRQLYSNALNGQAPAIFKTTWKGIPYWSVLFCWSVGLLGYMVLNDGASEAFSWITNILGGLYILSNLLQHITYLRFRKGLDAQGIDRSSLPFWKRGQRYISMVSIFFYSVIFLVCI